jgi:hypothetical protein
MRQYIKDNLTSGDYKHPGTNLLLMRKNLTNLGLDWVEAGNLIKDAISEKAVENKGFTLDGHQINDSTKLTYPPLAGDGYLNNLLQYWFFNKE